MHTQGFLEYVFGKSICVSLLILCFFGITHSAHAATIRNYSDTISTSAPGASANHTINFITSVAIPAGGFVRFTPDDGDFTIETVDFDIDNVVMYVATSSGYQLREATTTQSATEDGIIITTGTSGNIEISLNTTVGIPANANVRILIGDRTPNGTTTDVGITNPIPTGSYRYTLTAGDGITNTSVNGWVAVVEQVTVGDVDTRETDPPLRFNGAPNGDLSGNTTRVQMSLETNEFSKCRYSVASGTPFYSMGYEFTTNFTTIHAVIVDVASSTTYSYFIRCIDDENNINIDDYEITFTVLPPPEGTPGGGGDGQGTGTGGGSGTGSSGSGGGSSGGNSGGSNTGGGGSGGADGGGLETTGKPYQSGDGQLTITGYAFPKSTIVALVDGQIAESTQSDSNGNFSVLLASIARGAYTFGVYGVDKNGVKSSTFSTTFSITGSRASTLSNINVMPSLKITPNPVDPGAPLVITGYAIPDATITIENQNDKSSISLKTFTTTSDSNGAWTMGVDTAGFTKGTYKARAKAKQESGVSTNFSGYTYYGVGEAATVPRTSDLNRDSKVNLTDFSILLFWWGSDGGASNPPADINRDGKVSLTDFSIMIFNWTG
ncbi:MAG: dockerin type I domain-containing protein [Minisyncoccia bacterium]